MVSIDRLRELEESEELLHQVCVSIAIMPKARRGIMMYPIAGHPYVEGLSEWWTKNKPKTDREEKLDKIIEVITAYFDTDVRGNMELATASAESILKALEE